MGFVPIPLAPMESDVESSDPETESQSDEEQDLSQEEPENIEDENENIDKAISHTNATEEKQNGGNSSRTEGKVIIDPKEKSKWLASTWKLEPFNEKIPTSERKAEWRKYRDQFERIADCKMTVDPETKLKGMKIYAGEYLLSIIGMQEKLIIEPVQDKYKAVVEQVDAYFDLMCDKKQERMKFRQMKQKAEEAFADWVLRLENQSKFCDYDHEQRGEEFAQALMTNSIPSLASKLYEVANLLGQNLQKIIQHGQHLDILRMKEEEACKNELESIKTSDEDYKQTETKPIMMLRSDGERKWQSQDWREARYTPYRDARNNEIRRGENMRNWIPNQRGQQRFEIIDCQKCGRKHQPRRCPAYNKRCNSCKRYGHFEALCYGKMKDEMKTEDGKREKSRKHTEAVNQVQESDISE